MRHQLTQPVNAACFKETCSASSGSALASARHVRTLQIATLLWMTIECGVALYAAWQARSPALLAFGADSVIEMLSAVVVLMQFTRLLHLEPARAAQTAGILLFALAAAVALTSTLALVYKLHPETSLPGIVITMAALIIMPILSTLKRHEAVRTGNMALAADSVQSATCAYLALLTLAGLAINALYHLPWIDPVAALAAVPILVLEGVRTLRGEGCCCA